MVESTPIIFHMSAAFLLTVIPVLATMVLIVIRETSSSAFSLSNMLSAGMYFALGITGHHDTGENSQSFYFAKNVVIGMTFAAMMLRTQATSSKEAGNAKYARVNASETSDAEEAEEGGVELTGPSAPSNASKRNAFDFALDAPSGISPHFPIILAVFSYFSFVDAFEFAQVDHTGYGGLAEMVTNKVMMSICFGTAAAAESVMSKSLPKFSPIYFASSPLGVLVGFLSPANIPLFMTKYTYFMINGVCLYVATFQLLPEELKIKDATTVKMTCFVLGFFAVFITEYFLY
jgi:hypothetical protein